MLLKMVRSPNPGQKDMICQWAGKTVELEIGKTITVAEDEGKELLAKWPSCLVAIVPEAIPSKAATASTDTKVAKGYSNKKVSSAPQENESRS